MPFYAFPSDVRRILYTTNSIEALNSKLRRAVRARGHFPNHEAAAKLLFLVLNRTEKEWRMPTREWRWPRPSSPSSSASASCGQWPDKCQSARPDTKSLIVPIHTRGHKQALREVRRMAPLSAGSTVTLAARLPVSRISRLPFGPSPNRSPGCSHRRQATPTSSMPCMLRRWNASPRARLAPVMNLGSRRPSPSPMPVPGADSSSSAPKPVLACPMTAIPPPKPDRPG